MSRQLINELGNTITIALHRKDISGVPGVLISIAGPTSDIDLHITRREAEVLHEEPGHIVGKP